MQLCMGIQPAAAFARGALTLCMQLRMGISPGHIPKSAYFCQALMRGGAAEGTLLAAWFHGHEAGGVLRTSTRPTLNFFHLLRASV